MPSDVENTQLKTFDLLFVIVYIILYDDDMLSRSKNMLSHPENMLSHSNNMLSRSKNMLSHSENMLSRVENIKLYAGDVLSVRLVLAHFIFIKWSKAAERVTERVHTL